MREDEGDLVLPRGDVLFFGGDTAYPVATAEEIFRRVVAPWNEVLREVREPEDKPRVLLGIPGNHDWYDGLDGFGRFFRRRPRTAERTFESLRPGDARRAARRGRNVGLVARGLHLDEVGGRSADGRGRARRRSSRSFVGPRWRGESGSGSTATKRFKSRATGRCRSRPASSCGGRTGSSGGSTFDNAGTFMTVAARWAMTPGFGSSRRTRRSRTASPTSPGRGCSRRAS